jgi:GxxExxY protein
MFMRENEISKIVFEICLDIHRQYGPGLFESVYEEIICYELSVLGLKFERQIAVPVFHKEIKMEVGFRVDVIVEHLVILEIKSIEQLKSIHYKQLLTYLKLTDKKLGMLINFNVPLMKDGIHRVVNGL